MVSFPELSFEPMEDERLLLTLGGARRPGHGEGGGTSAQSRAMAHLLEFHLCEEGGDWPPMTRDFMRRWLRRLCQ